MNKSMTANAHNNGEHLFDIVNHYDAQCHILRNSCKRKAKTIMNLLSL